MANVPGGGSFLNPLFQVVSFGAGTALGPVLRPVLQDLQNTTWELHPVRPPDALTLAQGVAQGQVAEAAARAWAKQTGYDTAQFDALINIANVGPGVAQAYRMWRRNQFGEGGFRRAVQRLGLEAEWIDDLVALKGELLDPAQLAVMIQRTVVPNPGILPNQPSTAGSNVPPMPVVDIDVVTEALAAGIDKDRLSAMARIIGLPASPDLAARMHFRKIITEGAFNQAILEGNTRGEWAPFLLEGFRQILTAHQYAELELRGFYSKTKRRNKTAQWGMSDTDSDDLFDVLGRSINTHQIVTGEARGGTYKPPPATLAEQTAGIPPAFLASLQRGNLRPEYYDLAYANRYTYPSFFAIRALLTGRVLDADQGYQLLLEMGWKPSLARLVADHYGVATAAGSDPHVTKAQTQLWSTTHRSYIAGESDDTEATSALEAAGVAPTATGEVLTLWQHERSLIRKQLTPAQIKKAYQKVSPNYATGAAWTRDDALAALVERGYSVTEANDFLDIP